MNNALTRRIGFWFLAVASVASAAMGTAIVTGQLSSMNTLLVAGTATTADVYVGQSLVVVGAALLGAGILGGLLTVAVSLLQGSRTTPVPVPDARTDAASVSAQDTVSEASPVDEETADAAETSDVSSSADDIVSGEERQDTRSVPVA